MVGNGWILCGTGTVFNLIATRGNGTGMDLSQRDGTGLVMIFIPMSLSNGKQMVQKNKRVKNLSVVGHDGDGRFLHSGGDLVLNNVEHVLVIKQADEME